MEQELRGCLHWGALWTYATLPILLIRAGDGLTDVTGSNVLDVTDCWWYQTE